MKRLILIIGIMAFLTMGCFNASNDSNYVEIKYREDKVDISHSRWEYLDTSKSSWIRGAWYDKGNQYMIINLNGTRYHFCELPSSTWNRYKKAESFGSDYNEYIKGNYDCRIYYTPEY